MKTSLSPSSNRAASFALLATILAAPLTAAPGRALGVAEADIRAVETLEQAVDLAREMTASATTDQTMERVWVAYRVESVENTGLCCFRGNCCDLEIEDGPAFTRHPEPSSEPIKLGGLERDSTGILAGLDPHKPVPGVVGRRPASADSTWLQLYNMS